MRFCPPNCKYLKPTEEEQDKQELKSPHICQKYMVSLFHRGCHPNIVRLEDCKYDY